MDNRFKTAQEFGAHTSFKVGNVDGVQLPNSIKYKVIDYLYSKVDLSKHRYDMLSLDKLKYLQENEHYLSLNYKGFNYYLIIFETEYQVGTNKKYCILIDKKKLKYNKNQLDMKTTHIVQIHMNLPEELYKGSIFYGKLSQSSSKSLFIIQDCFYLSGNNLLKMDMIEKIHKIDKVINSFNTNYCSLIYFL